MYEMSQRHPVWVAENHVIPCNSVQYNDIQLNVAALCQYVICLQTLAFFTGAKHPFFWLAVNVYTVRLIYEIPFRFQPLDPQFRGFYLLILSTTREMASSSLFILA